MKNGHCLHFPGTRESITYTAMWVHGVGEVCIEERHLIRRWWHGILLGRLLWRRELRRFGVWIRIRTMLGPGIYEPYVLADVRNVLERVRPVGIPYHVVTEFPRWLKSSYL